MIKIKVTIKTLDGKTFTNIEEVHSDYMISRQNPDFMHLIEKNIKESRLEEIDTVGVKVDFGEM